MSCEGRTAPQIGDHLMTHAWSIREVHWTERAVQQTFFTIEGSEASQPISRGTQRYVAMSGDHVRSRNRLEQEMGGLQPGTESHALL